MASPIWYLGPSGDLRALECPEVDIDMPMERYGGVFQALSGARTVDTTGYRQRFDFLFNYMDEGEYKWLEAMHTRLIPGPLRLLNPFKKNRLSPESAAARWGGGTAPGLQVTSGNTALSWDWPSGAGSVGAVSTLWTDRLSNAVFRADLLRRTTVIVGETITASIYMKAEAATTYNLVVDWYNRTSQTTSTSIVTANLTTSWQRFSVTSVVPAGTHSAVFAGYSSNTTNDVWLGPVQFEAAASATSWDLGGGAPVVSIDQLPTKSPRYPLRNAELILLEV